MNAGNPAVEHHKAPRIGLVVGLVVFIAMLLSSAPEGLDDTAWRVAALGVLMAIFWMTEAIPIPATAMLPIPLIPLLNIASVKESVVAYSHPVIFCSWGDLLWLWLWSDGDFIYVLRYLFCGLAVIDQHSFWVGS